MLPAWATPHLFVQVRLFYNDSLVFLALQFPMADLRKYIPEGSRGHDNLLKCPNWYAPQPGKDFVKSFGGVVHRKQGGAESWAGEEVFCDARRAIIFGKKPIISNTSKQRKIAQYCAFRRLFCRPQGVARVEVGLQLRNGGSGKCIFHYEDELMGVMKSALQQYVMIPDSEERIYHLCDVADPILARFRRSTERRLSPEVGSQDKASEFLRKGRPLIYCEYRKGQWFHERSKRQEFIGRMAFENHGISVDVKRLKANKEEYTLWMMGVDGRSDGSFLRNMRINIFRIHAEREFMKAVFRGIINGKIPAEKYKSDELQRYLLDGTKFINRGNSDLSSAQAMAHHLEDLVYPGERDTLLEQLKYVRKNVIKLVEAATLSPAGRSVLQSYDLGETISTTIIQGDYIVNNIDNRNNRGSIINNINGIMRDIQVRLDGQNPSGEKRKEILDLTKQIQSELEKILSGMSPDAQREAGTAWKTLSDQALSDNPQQKWYSISSSGLIDAAKTVGKISDPIIKAVTKLTTLLAATP